MIKITSTSKHIVYYGIIHDTKNIKSIAIVNRKIGNIHRNKDPADVNYNLLMMDPTSNITIQAYNPLSATDSLHESFPNRKPDNVYYER